jgi:hypothetical protein
MVAKLGKVDAVDCLIELKADLDAVNNRKTTALHLACRKGNERVVKSLLMAKVRVISATRRLCCRRGHWLLVDDQLSVPRTTSNVRRVCLFGILVFAPSRVYAC